MNDRATIEHIQYPFCFTKCGKRIEIKDITGEPRAKDTLEVKGNGWVIVGKSNDSDCVNGVCPIK